MITITDHETDHDRVQQALRLVAGVDVRSLRQSGHRHHSDALTALVRLSDAIEEGNPDRLTSDAFEAINEASSNTTDPHPITIDATGDGGMAVAAENTDDDLSPDGEWGGLSPDTRAHQALWAVALWHDDYGRDHYATTDDVIEEYGEPFENRNVLASSLANLSKRYGATESRIRPKAHGKKEHRITERGIDFLSEHGYPEGKYGVPAHYQRDGAED